jgi:DNA-binding MarR family transcriptional regulator
MKRKLPKVTCVNEPRRLAALASPLRIELVGALQTHGPSSIRELALHLDRAADGLYHHVRTLMKAGMVVEQSHRKSGRRVEAVYALTARRVAGKLDPSSSEGKVPVIRAGVAALRLAAREFRAAIESDAVSVTHGVANTRVSRQRTWLTDRGLIRLYGLLGQIERLLQKENTQKQGRLHSLTVVLAPCVKRRTFQHEST